MEITTLNQQQTQKLASSFSKKISPPVIICLFGDLGAGKTCFVKGFCKGLGIKDIVNSPTYSIVNIYESSIKIIHIDAYRIKSPDEMISIGLEDYLDEDAIIFIEWPEVISNLLPEKRINIHINSLTESRRIIKIYDNQS